MSAPVSTRHVWAELDKQLFAVVGFVTDRAEARTAGIVYTVENRILYFGSGVSAWKTKHLAANPSISMTVTVPKRIPFVPWIKIPPATVSFSGTARILQLADVSPTVAKRLLHGLDPNDVSVAEPVIVEVVPKNDFLTYGVGVSMKTMMNPSAVRGRAPVR